LKSFLVQQKNIGAESNRNWPNSPEGDKKSILAKVLRTLRAPPALARRRGGRLAGRHSDPCENGFAARDCTHKPANGRIIAAYLLKERAIPTQSKSEHARPAILIVDDEREVQSLLGGLLRGQQYQVRYASDGITGYQSALSIPPDLILLDLHMPGMDGFAACRLLKGNALTAGIPVIFLGAREHSDDRVTGLAMGGVDFLAKPCVPAEVFERVRIHLELASLRRDAAAQAAPAAPLREAEEVLATAAMRELEVQPSEPLTPAGSTRALGAY